MIYAVDSGNKIIGPIDSWNTLKADLPLKKVVLTDGHGLFRQLSGFDFYYAEKESLAGLSNGVNRFIPQAISSVLIREAVYGIRDISKAKEELLTWFNHYLAGIYNSQKDVQNRVKVCRSRYDSFLDRLQNKEVSVISLVTTGANLKLKNVKINKSQLKAGDIVEITASDILGKRYWTHLKV